MAKQHNALLHEIDNIGNGRNNKANIIDSGQLGIGSHLPQIDGSTPEVFIPAVPVITHTPTFFKNFPKAEAILKALVERHAKEITGIDFGQTIEAGQTIVGHDKQELNMPLSNSRSAIEPTMVMQEIKGNLVWDFFKFWMDLMRHADTNASALAAISGEGELSPQLISTFTMDITWIQFDVTLRPENIIDGFSTTAMWPYETGMYGLQRTIGTTQLQERSIPFYGIMQHNKNTYNAAKAIAEVLKIHRADYEIAQPVAQKVNDRIKEEGLANEINQIASEFQDLGSGGDSGGTFRPVG